MQLVGLLRVLGQIAFKRRSLQSVTTRHPACILQSYWVCSNMAVDLSQLSKARLKNSAGTSILASQLWAATPVLVMAVRRPGCGMLYLCNLFDFDC